MNKRILGAGAASLVLAAMPLVGVFAEDTTEITDTVKVTIAESCTMGITSGVDQSETLAENAISKEITGAAFAITCNDADGWHLTAEGAGTGVTKTDMVGEVATNLIKTGVPSAGTSAWGFKVTADDGVASGYDSMHAIPAYATTIASGEAPVSAKSVKITYQVSSSTTQAADTYTGKVKYVLSQGQE